MHYGHLPRVGVHGLVATSGGISTLAWVLWAALALFFGALYIAVYVWMRRPKFGEGPQARHAGQEAMAEAPPTAQDAMAAEAGDGPAVLDAPAATPGAVASPSTDRG